MKFTLAWLREHLDTAAALPEIVDALVGVGLEVEEAVDAAASLAPFKVAYVREAKQHPNADRLRVCLLETDGGEVQVVCGAPNARTGMKGIFAPVGTYIPGTGIDLKKGVIRGVESHGMLLSERELRLSEDHDGIIEVADDLPVGTPAAAALGLDDAMIYIKVTPNRPDALGVRGIARDLAAKGLGTLKPLIVPKVAAGFASPIDVVLNVAGDGKACPLFIGRFFRNVRNGPSPDWLQRRLRAVGLRPISALVDITNFVTLAYNRPLHVFDADRIAGPIQARMAKDGETIEALDGRTYSLDASMTVIADRDRAVGIAGIMGGMQSGCTPETVNVFLEAALFDPLRTAATGRKLQIQSDARYRFERGVDPAFVPDGVEIASAMILDLCGGEASKTVVAGKIPETRRSFTLRKSRVKSLGGVDVPWPEQKRILVALGFGVTEGAGGLACTVPSWRPDVGGEADLVEEVCRIVGLDKVPAAPMSRPHAVARPVLSTLQRRTLLARRRLAGRGLDEAVTWSFLSTAHAELFGGGRPELKLVNPISSELTDMRPSLLPNLVAAAGRNLARGLADVALFEIGQAYAGDRPQDETLRAAGIRQGRDRDRHWSGEPRPVDVYDAKADAIAVLMAAGAPPSGLQVIAEAPAWFHPGRSGSIKLGPKTVLAVFGEIHPRVLRAMDVKGPLVAFEAVLDAIPEAKGRLSARPALDASDLMPVSRDFAFLVDADLEADRIVRAARSADRNLISAVNVFDVFTGGAVGGGRKSVAIEVVLQPRDRTLTETEIDAIGRRIVDEVAKATGAVLRTS